MADTAFTVKVDNRTFVLDRISLGDWRMLKTQFGLNASDIVTEIKNAEGETIQILNVDDPNVLVGLIVAALTHERPTVPVSQLIAEVEALGMDGLEFPNGSDDEEEPDPTPAADSAATDAPAKSGKSAKRQKQPGTQS